MDYTKSQSHYVIWYWNTYKDILKSKRFAIAVIKKMRWF